MTEVFALIGVDNTVENIIVADATFTIKGYTAVRAVGAAIGDVYDISTHSFLRNDVSLTPEQVRVNMPQLSMVDFRRKLRGIKVIQREGEAELDGIYEADILAKIDLIADKELAAEARDYFLYAQYIERINPWVEILGSMFDITPEEIDTFWMA